MMNRRSLLKGMALAAFGLAAPALPGGMSEAAARTVGKKSLAFESLHTGEILKVTYWADGAYLRHGCREIDRILRDWRTDNIHTMDRKLFDVLFDLRRLMDSSQPFHIISGYRSPRTNAKLARRSRGVARHSLHMQGMAVDVALPGRDLASLRKAALALGRGGVGYYPRSGFIHVDTGRVRQWG